MAGRSNRHDNVCLSWCGRPLGEQPSSTPTARPVISIRSHKGGDSYTKPLRDLGNRFAPIGLRSQHRLMSATTTHAHTRRPGCSVNASTLSAFTITLTGVQHSEKAQRNIVAGISELNSRPRRDTTHQNKNRERLCPCTLVHAPSMCSTCETCVLWSGTART